MIAKVTRGWRAGGLVRYLMGPGRANDHTEQRVVASWDGQPDLHAPPRNGRGGFDVAELVAELTDPAVAAGVPQTEPEEVAGRKRPAGPVWHCSLRNHADDPVLTDAQWAEVAAQVMDRTGIAPRGDLGACRWVAIRHADDHVHIAAVLVRRDTLRRVHPYRDYLRAGEVCREAEARLGLTATAPADRTALTQSTRAELEKAARRNQPETSRVWLRSTVRLAAVQARDPQEFFRRLADLGVVCRPKQLDGRLVGYAVTAPGDLTAAGRPVWYSGSRLGRDLTLPKLRARWASAPPPAGPLPPAPGEYSRVGRAERDAATGEALAAINHATTAVAAAAAGGDAGAGGVVAGVAHAAGDMTTALAEVTEPRGLRKQGPHEREHWQPANRYARAAGTPHTVQPARLGPVAAQLRTAAWRLVAVRSLADRDAARAAELIVALAALVAEIAAYYQQSRHLAQARAARDSAQLLRQHHQQRRPAARPTTPPSRGPAQTRPTPTMAPPPDYLRRTRQGGLGRGRGGPGFGR